MSTESASKRWWFGRIKPKILQPKIISGVRDGSARERFISVSQFALLRALAAPERWAEGEDRRIARFFDNLTRWRNLAYSDQLDRLTQHYLPFSPDADTMCDGDIDEWEKLAHKARLFGELSALIEQANYDPITEQELDLILEARSPYGVEVSVDLDDFEELMLYARGASDEERWERDWRFAYLRKRGYKVPVFQRLFLALKLKPDNVRVREIMEAHGLDEESARKRLRKERAHFPPGVSANHVYLKLFKCIPQIDLEMLFPNNKVKLKALDKLQLWVTGGSGGVVGVVTGVPKILASVATFTVNPIGLLMALGGLGGLFFRQVMNFFNTRNKYMMQLAQSLYFQNLSSNRGVLTLMIDRAEEEDIKEDALLYTLLHKTPVRRDEIGDAKAAIEHFLEQTFDIRIDYDITDAMRRLQDDGLMREAEDGTLRVRPPEEACAHIRALWLAALDTDTLAVLEQPQNGSMASAQGAQG